MQLTQRRRSKLTVEVFHLLSRVERSFILSSDLPKAINLLQSCQQYSNKSIAATLTDEFNTNISFNYLTAHKSIIFNSLRNYDISLHTIYFSHANLRAAACTKGICSCQLALQYYAINSNIFYVNCKYISSVNYLKSIL